MWPVAEGRRRPPAACPDSGAGTCLATIHVGVDLATDHHDRGARRPGLGKRRAARGDLAGGGSWHRAHVLGVTPSPTRGPTWRPRKPGRPATATTGRPRARRCSPPARRTRTTIGRSPARHPRRQNAGAHHVPGPVDLLPRVEITPIQTLGGERTNTVYLDDVRVRDHYRVGPAGQGWKVVAGALDAEHRMGRIEDRGIGDDGNLGTWQGLVHRLTDAGLRWAATAQHPDGTPVIDDPLVRERLARVALNAEVASLPGGPMGKVCQRHGIDPQLGRPRSTFSPGGDPAGGRGRRCLRGRRRVSASLRAGRGPSTADRSRSSTTCWPNGCLSCRVRGCFRPREHKSAR